MPSSRFSGLLQVFCRQDDGQLSTKVYRKPTHTERYLSFDSHHPAAHKRAVVKSLTDRAKTIPSSVDQQSKEMQHVTAALRANGYPKRFVIDVSKPKRPSQQTPATAPDDKKGFCILPYIKDLPGDVSKALLKTSAIGNVQCWCELEWNFFTRSVYSTHDSIELIKAIVVHVIYNRQVYTTHDSIELIKAIVLHVIYNRQVYSTHDSIELIKAIVVHVIYNRQGGRSGWGRVRKVARAIDQTAEEKGPEYMSSEQRDIINIILF
ncbi:hypothetical protein ACROYT_G006195 [Oculina patagonica]